jgi:hypothetical protein
MRVKKLSGRLLGAVVAFLLSITLAGTAFAAWPQYQGNGNHNGRIVGATPPIGSIQTDLYADLNAGIDTESVMNTETDFETGQEVVYSYTVTSGGDLVKVNVETQTEVWRTPIGTSGYQLGSPALVPNGTYSGVYVPATDYYWLVENSQFTTGLSGWGTYNPPTQPPVTWVPNLHAVLDEGDYLWQDFVYTGDPSTQSTELFSQTMLQLGSTSPGAVNYKVTDSSGAVVAQYLALPGSTSVWTEVEQYFNTGMVKNNTYRITVTATVGNIYLHHVGFGWQTSGISKVSFDGQTITPIGGTDNAGQANTPISIYLGTTGHNFLYYGSMNSTYYQINLENPTDVKEYASGHREYWAGATMVTINSTDYVVFGSDEGYLHVTEVGANFGDPDPSHTKVINLSVGYGVAAGNVRSTVSQDGGYIYFTSQRPDGSTQAHVWQGSIVTLLDQTPALTPIAVPVNTTSTPAISANGYVYFGTYQDPGGIGVVFTVKTSTFTASALIDIYLGDAVQSSPLVYSVGTVDYIYFTTNTGAPSGTGKGYGYSFNTARPGSPAVQVWSVGGTSGDTYALQGFAAEGAYLVYGDDSGRLYVVTSV